MNIPFNAKTFLTCPQGPRLVGTARDRACRLLDMAITQGRVLLAARLLTRDPSLITEELGESISQSMPAVHKALVADMNVLVLFALEHGMSVNDTSFGDPRGLLESAIAVNSPGLVSCALLHHRGLNRIQKGDIPSKHPCYISDPIFATALSCAWHGPTDVTRAKGTQIVNMLLDAGVVPKTPAVFSSAIFAEWPNHSRFNPLGSLSNELLAPLLKYGGHAWANIRQNNNNNNSIVTLAAREDNLEAVKMLIAAGAEMDDQTLVAIKTRRCIKTHIPELDALRETYLAQANSASTDIAPDTADPFNLPPEGFMGTPQGPRTCGTVREDLLTLLEMAITQGLFATATKILAQDPSLITDSLGAAGHKQLPAMAMAVCAGMEALVPFALAQGVAPNTPIYTKTSGEVTAPRGLLDVANGLQSPGLASYALLYRADPNQSVGYDYYGGIVINLHSFLNFSCVDPRSIGGRISVAHMLLGARMKVMPDTVPPLISLNSVNHEDQYAQLLAAILKRNRYSCINMQVNRGSHLIRYAAELKKIYAVKQLITAGANIDPEFLGEDLFTILKKTGQVEHIPALSELIMRRQMSKTQPEVLASSVTITTDSNASKTRMPKLTARDIF